MSKAIARSCSSKLMFLKIWQILQVNTPVLFILKKYFYCQLFTFFAPFSIVSVVHFKQVKLGSHCGNHICRLRRRNLIASVSSPNVRRRSIPTNCLHPLLSSTTLSDGFFQSLYMFCFYKTYQPWERNLLGNFQGRIIFSK